MSLLPSNPDTRKKINDAINEFIVAKRKADDAASHMTDICARVDGELGMSKTEFRKRATLRYQQEFNPSKYEGDKEFFDSAFDENEILKEIK